MAIKEQLIIFIENATELKICYESKNRIEFESMVTDYKVIFLFDDEGNLIDMFA